MEAAAALTIAHVVETAPAFNIALAEPEDIKPAIFRAEKCAAVIPIVIVEVKVAPLPLSPLHPLGRLFLCLPSSM